MWLRGQWGIQWDPRARHPEPILFLVKSRKSSRKVYPSLLRWIEVFSERHPKQVFCSYTSGELLIYSKLPRFNPWAWNPWTTPRIVFSLEGNGWAPGLPWSAKKTQGREVHGWPGSSAGVWTSSRRVLRPLIPTSIDLLTEPCLIWIAPDSSSDMYE